MSCYGFDIHFDTSVEMKAEMEARMLYILASPYFSDKNSLKLKIVDSSKRVKFVSLHSISSNPSIYNVF